VKEAYSWFDYTYIESIAGTVIRENSTGHAEESDSESEGLHGD
jgi:hypothetical protein